MKKLYSPFFLRTAFVVLLMLTFVRGWGQLNQSFESGLPSSYSTTLTATTLGSEIWEIQNVIAGTTGVQTGTKSAQIRSAANSRIISPSFSVGLGTLTFYVTGSTATSGYEVNISTDGGANWNAASGSPFTIGTTKTLRTIVINNSAVNKIEILRTAGTVYIDDVKTTAYSPSGKIVTFNSNYGTPTTTTQTSSTAGNLTTNPFGRTGYTFTNWHTTTSGTGGTTYTNGQNYDFLADLTLYAQWIINSYNVIYDLNGGTGTTPTTQNGNYNTNLTLASGAGFSRAGYTFNGWNTAIDGSGTAYASGATYTVPASTQTLYAQWVSTAPFITTSGTLSGLTTIYGTASGDTSFTVSAGNLTNDLIITPPSGFEVSESAGSGFATSLNLGTGNRTNKQIFGRLAATTAAGTYSGNIALASTGVTTVNVATVNSTVSKKPLTVNIAASSKVYDGSASAVLNTPTLSGILFSDDVSVMGTAIGTFADKNAGTGKTVTVTGLSFTGTKAGNYSLPSSITTTADISKLNIAVTGAAAQNKPYDGTNTAVITGTLTGVINPDNVTLNGTGTFASVNAGTGIAVTSTSTLTGAASGNYSLTQPTGLSANITKATPIYTPTTISVTVGATQTIPASVSDSPGTLTFVSNNTGTATVNATTGAVTGVAVGSTTIDITQAESTNYIAGSTSVTVNVSTITYVNGDYRTVENAGAITYTSNSSTPGQWQIYNTASLNPDKWDSSNSPILSTTASVYISKGTTVTTGVQFNSGPKLYVMQGGSFISKHNCSFNTIYVYGGGRFEFSGSVVSVSTLLEVEDNGTFVYNYAGGAGSGLSLWNGKEQFHPKSTFEIQNHDTAGTSYFFPPAANFTPYTENGITAYFGKLVVNSSNGQVRLATNNLSSSSIYLTAENLEFAPRAAQQMFFGSGTWVVGGDFVLNKNSAVSTAFALGLIGGTTTGLTVNLNVKGSYVSSVNNTFRLLNDTGNTWVSNFNVDGNVNISNGIFDVVYTDNGTSTFNINGNLNLTGTGIMNLSQSSGGKGIVNLKGNLFVDNTARIYSFVASPTNAKFNFVGTTDQEVNVKSINTTNTVFNINNAAKVKLVSQDFNFGSNTKLNLLSGATLNFNVDGSGNSLNIVKTLSATGTSFTQATNTDLYITSSQGIQTSGASGNVQTDTRNFATAIPYADFHFIGTAQSTGDALPVNVRDLVINNTDNTNEVLLTNASLNVTRNLEVQKGIFNLNDKDVVGAASSALNIEGLATLKIAGTKTFPTGFTSIAFKPTSIVEYGGAAQSIAVTGETNYTNLPVYENLKISGTNIKSPATDLTVNNITTVTGGTLQINETADNVQPHVFTAKKGLQNTGGTVLLANNANLLQDVDAANVGNVTMERKATVPSTQYNYWAFPVKDQPLYGLYGALDMPDKTVKTYNTATDFFTNLLKSSNPISLFAKGYSIKGPTTATVAPYPITATFVGEPNNESTTPSENTTPLSTVGARYNLIGNPYPSNLNLVELYNANVGQFHIDGADTPTAYLWDNTGNIHLIQQGPEYANYATNNYATVNLSSGIGTSATSPTASVKKPNGIVRPGQGFIIKAATGATSLTFKNNLMRTSSIVMGGTNSEYFKNSSANNDNFWLTLTTPSNMNVVIAMSYNPNAENTFERFDSRVPNEAVTENFFSLSSDAKKLAIQSRKDFTTSDVVPLGIKSSKIGIQKISIDEKYGIFENQTIYLKDKLLNIVADLSSGAYEFTTPIGVTENRFEIVYEPNITLGAGNTVKESLQVYRSGENFIVKSGQNKIDKVEVYDAAGRLLKSLKGNSNEIIIEASALSSGMYILNINRNNETINKKIIK